MSTKNNNSVRVKKSAMEIYLTQSKWSHAISLIQANPSCARERIQLSLPLHIACSNMHDMNCNALSEVLSTEEFIKVCIDAFPEALLIEIDSNLNNNSKHLMNHHTRSNGCTVKAPAAAAGGGGALYPLHMLVSNSLTSPSLIEYIVQNHPDTVLLKDKNGLRPIQRAVLFCLSDVIVYTLYLAECSIQGAVSFNTSSTYTGTTSTSNETRLATYRDKDNNQHQFIQYVVGGNICEIVGNEALNREDFQDAEAKLKEALAAKLRVSKEHDRTLLSLYVKLSIVHRKLKRYDDADVFIANAMIIIKNYPRDDQGNNNSITNKSVGYAYFEKGLIRYKQNDAKKALKYLARAGMAYKDAGYDINHEIVQNLKRTISKVFRVYLKLGNSQRQNSFSESEKINISSRPQESVLIYEIVNHNWRAAQSRCLKYPEEASKWSEIVSNKHKHKVHKIIINSAPIVRTTINIRFIFIIICLIPKNGVCAVFKNINIMIW